MAETYMKRPAALSEKRKAQIRAEEKAELDAAEKARKRPLSARAVSAYQELNPMTPARVKKEARESAAQDARAREERYQSARKRYDTPFEQRKEYVRDDTPAQLTKEELDKPLFRKGGVVRGAGCERKGKTRGQMR